MASRQFVKCTKDDGTKFEYKHLKNSKHASKINRGVTFQLYYQVIFRLDQYTCMHVSDFPRRVKRPRLLLRRLCLAVG